MTMVLTPDEAAGQLKIPRATLAYWRSQGKGPAFVKVGRHVRYTQQAIEDFLAELAPTT